jgi:ATP-dependent Lon protease
MNVMTKIGLFPLGLVLFPEAVYPLHIFEERYKQLINECIEEGKVFGINLMTEKNMQHIGCTAKVSDIMKTYPDGKLDLLVTGISRYKIIKFSQSEKPYYTAEIEYIEDNEKDISTLLLDDSIELFNKIAENLRSIKVDKITRNELKTEQPSFYMAQKAGLSFPQKQYLLEMLSENKRMEYVISHMRKILPIIKNKDQMNEILKNDGYYKPDFFKS